MPQRMTNEALVEELRERYVLRRISEKELNPLTTLILEEARPLIAKMEALLAEDSRRQSKLIQEKFDAKKELEFFTCSEAAKLFGCNSWTLGRKAAKGEIPSVLHGSVRLYPKRDILDLCAQRQRTSGNDPAPDGQR